MSGLVPLGLLACLALVVFGWKGLVFVTAIVAGLALVGWLRGKV